GTGAVVDALGVTVRIQILPIGPLAVRLLLGDPDIGAPAAARAPAHEIEGLAVRRDSGLLIDGIAVDRVRQPFGRSPVRARAGPLAALADPVGDEDIRRRAQDALVTATREAGEVDGVAVGRDLRLIAAKLVARRERHL